MKPIFRNNPNMPVDINDTAYVAEVAIDSTGDGVVASMLTTSTIMAAYSAEVADTFVDVSGDAVAGDGIVTIDSTDAYDLNVILVYSNN